MRMVQNEVAVLFRQAFESGRYEFDDRPASDAPGRRDRGIRIPHGSNRDDNCRFQNDRYRHSVIAGSLRCGQRGHMALPLAWIVASDLKAKLADTICLQ